MKKLLTTALLLTLALATINITHAYTNTKYTFTINPPPGWTTTEPANVTVAFVGPLNEDFPVNMNILVVTTNKTITQFVTASEQALQTSLTNYTTISEAPRTINNITAYEIVYTFTYQNTTIKQKQVYLIKNTEAFIITYSASATTYPKYLSAFETSIQTFQTTAGTDWWLWPTIIIIIIATIAAIALLTGRKKSTKTRHKHHKPPK
jgi:hypothetical protein